MDEPREGLSREQLAAAFRGEFDEVTAEAISTVVTDELSSAEDRSAQVLVGAVVLSALGVYAAERRAGGAVRTFGDALWSAFNAVSGVGDSGCPPVTPAGRLATSLLVLLGQPLLERVRGRLTRVVGRLAGLALPDGPAGPAATEVAAAAAGAAAEAASFAAAAQVGAAVRNATGEVTGGLAQERAALQELNARMARAQELLVAMERRQSAGQEAMDKFEQWKQQQDELLARLEALIVRASAQPAATSRPGPVPAPAAATALAPATKPGSAPWVAPAPNLPPALSPARAATAPPSSAPPVTDEEPDEQPRAGRKGKRGKRR